MEELKTRHPQMLRSYSQSFLNHAEPFDTFELPADGERKGTPACCGRTGWPS